MDLVLARPDDRDGLILGAGQGDQFALDMLCIVSNALAEIKAHGGCCLCCRKSMGSRAARRGTFAVAYWPDEAFAWRLFCQRCATAEPDALLDQATESLLAQLRFQLHGAGAVAAIGYA
jgi:hypothetical protein